jgi:hypothetical protein
MKEWISVKDRTPVTGQEVLFCSNSEDFVPTQFGLYLGDKFKEKRFYSHDSKSYDATHWMPLPDAYDENVTTRCEHSGIEWDKDGKVVGVNP